VIDAAVQLWHAALSALETFLVATHGFVEPVFGGYAWGVAIILVTMTIRLALVPLAIKQISSMRDMQAIQPEMKKVQDKYKVDRSLMREDPEKYREKKQKQQEEMQKLYQEHNINPLASCLPIVAQAPILIALFRLLRAGRPEGLQGADFLLISDLSAATTAAGTGAFLILAVMVASMFFSQKQIMASRSGGEMQTQQKIITYVIPGFLAIIGLQVPVGVVLYWTTQNLWQLGQQTVMMRYGPGAKNSDETSTDAAKKAKSGGTATSHATTGSDGGT